VTELEASRLAPALVAQESVVAALEATLASYRAPESMIHQVPMLQLLSTPLENLQQRCERIAPLLAECEAVASAEVVSRPSVWLDEGASQQTSPSWAIVVRPAEMPVDRFARSLEVASPRVIGCVEQEAYRLDFRALFPRWDQGLVAAVEQMGRS
jgi:seryl-tRNA(Sec) selenium transferase